MKRLICMIFWRRFEKAYVAMKKKRSVAKFACKMLPAVTLWRKMLSMLFETGHPWVTFKDAV